MKNQRIEQFFSELTHILKEKILVKITLSKYVGKEDVKNIYIKPVTIKNKELLSFVYRHTTKDITKNYEKKEAIYILKKLVANNFLHAHVITDSYLITLETSQDGAIKLHKKPSALQKKLSQDHDKQKNYRIPVTAPFLRELDVVSQHGIIKADKYDKYRQINKFIEIVDSVYSASELTRKDRVSVVDFGSGKSYLTFAMYYYFTEVQKKQIEMQGVEFRTNMVKISNTIAKKLNYEGLSFKEGTIQEYSNTDVDIVIALHACDTATDDAIMKGIISNSKLIIVAPCCHKYVRKHMSSPEEHADILKYGILAQRESEILTDGLRALTLEYFGYKTQVLEFISQEYTSKNLMITATKKTSIMNTSKLQTMQTLMQKYSLKDFYLDTLLTSTGLLRR